MNDNKIKPNSECCKVCGFNFDKFSKCNFDINNYYHDVKIEDIPKHLLNKMQQQAIFK